jgi:DNA-directed RNA polymerase specialized sigma24 family protein
VNLHHASIALQNGAAIIAVLVARRRPAHRSIAVFLQARPWRTPGELVAQTKIVRGLIAYSLRGTPATREDVEDLTQEVILGAWLASEADRYRPDPAAPPVKALRGWLWKLVYHHVDHHRESARVRREVLIEPSCMPDESIDPEGQLEARAELARIQALPPEVRAVAFARLAEVILQGRAASLSTASRRRREAMKRIRGEKK